MKLFLALLLWHENSSRFHSFSRNSQAITTPPVSFSHKTEPLPQLEYPVLCNSQNSGLHLELFPSLSHGWSYLLSNSQPWTFLPLFTPPGLGFHLSIQEWHGGLFCIGSGDGMLWALCMFEADSSVGCYWVSLSFPHWAHLIALPSHGRSTSSGLQLPLPFQSNTPLHHHHVPPVLNF